MQTASPFTFTTNGEGAISCLSRFWSSVFFSSQNNSPISDKDPNNLWLKLLLWCFPHTEKKKVFIHFAIKGSKEGKAFPSLVSVHCQHIKYSMWFMLIERNEKEKRESGRLMLWSFMYKHIGGKHISSPRPSKLSALRVLAVIVSNKAV